MRRRVLHIPTDDDGDLDGLGGGLAPQARESSPTRLSVFLPPKQQEAIRTPKPPGALRSPRNSNGKRERSADKAVDGSMVLDVLNLPQPSSFSPVTTIASPAAALARSVAAAPLSTKQLSDQSSVISSSTAFVKSIGASSELLISFRGVPVLGDDGLLVLPRNPEVVNAMRTQLEAAVGHIQGFDRRIRLVDESAPRPTQSSISASGRSSSSSSSSASSSSRASSFDPADVNVSSASELRSLTVPHLKAVLKSLELPVSGNKQTLVQRVLGARGPARRTEQAEARPSVGVMSMPEHPRRSSTSVPAEATNLDPADVSPGMLSCDAADSSLLDDVSSQKPSSQRADEPRISAGSSLHHVETRSSTRGGSNASTGVESSAPARSSRGLMSPLALGRDEHAEPPSAISVWATVPMFLRRSVESLFFHPRGGSGSSSQVNHASAQL